MSRSCFVMIFRCDAGRDFVHERNARHALPGCVEQMHDVAAGNKKAVAIPEFA